MDGEVLLSLQVLNRSHNLLRGEIPLQFGELEKLEAVYLSHNALWFLPIHFS